ncbi:redoxin domain-containing protein [Candidatus Woesearchaeota archaeon]|nr:redoxin domain-containing protein [Candidatus Woesearchaeota archaeon]
MNKTKTLLLILVVVLVILSIFFLQSLKVQPSSTPSVIPPQQTTTQEITPQENSQETTSPTQEETQAYKEKATKYQLAPELTGITGYLNTESGLKLQDLRGKVVLIDFWTYTCINCIRTLPHVTEWYNKYHDDGLVVIGVHTPEFAFEKKYENVLAAVQEHAILYPVVQDNDYKTWRAFNNRYWPAKYLIDKDGFIRYTHFGEGKYQETEKIIQELLSEITEIDQSVSTLPDETPQTRNTPELYAGYDFALTRAQNIGNPEGLQPEQSIDYTLPTYREKNIIYLEGTWKSNKDDLESQDEGKILLDFTASTANIVAEAPTPLRIEVLINHAPVSSSQAGTDILFENGKSFILVQEPRLYNPIKGTYGSYTLTFKTQKGFKFNAFTFG